jgi:hypothetical protein
MNTIGRCSREKRHRRTDGQTPRKLLLVPHDFYGTLKVYIQRARADSGGSSLSNARSSLFLRRVDSLKEQQLFTIVNKPLHAAHWFELFWSARSATRTLNIISGIKKDFTMVNNPFLDEISLT